MTEEKNEAVKPVQQTAPAPAQAAPTTAPANTAGAAPAKKGMSGCVIALIVVLILAVVGGVAGYFIYRYVKNKVKTAVETTTGVVGSTSTTGTSDSSSTDPFKAAENQTPTESFAKSSDNIFKPVFKTVMGDAKLRMYYSQNNGASLDYIFPRKVTTADYQSIEKTLTAAGFTTTSSGASGDGYSLTMTKGDTDNVSIAGSSDDQSIMVVHINTAL